MEERFDTWPTPAGLFLASVLLLHLGYAAHESVMTRERVRQLEGQALKRLEALRDLAGLAA